MDFFKQLLEITGEVDLSLRMKSKEGKITLSLLPTTQSNITPLIVTGTAEELDNSFIDLIRKPMQETAVLVANTEAYTESVKAASDKAAEKLTGKKTSEKAAGSEKPKQDKKAAKTEAEKSGTEADSDLSEETMPETEAPPVDKKPVQQTLF